MPTAVERLATVISETLSFDAIDNPVSEAVFPSLDTQVDPGLTALGLANSPGAFFSADLRYGFGFEALGAGAAGLGFDLQRDAVVFDLINEALGGGNAFGDGGGSGFAAFDTGLFGAGGALESFGSDFAGLGQVRTEAGLTKLEAALAGDANTLAGDFANFGQSLATLVTDLDGGGNANGGVTTVSPYAALGSALTPIEAEIASISSDFTALANAFGDGGGAGKGGMTADSSTGGGGGAGKPLSALFSDFLALDGSFQSLGAPIANLLLPAVTNPTTT